MPTHLRKTLRTLSQSLWCLMIPDDEACHFAAVIYSPQRTILTSYETGKQIAYQNTDVSHFDIFHSTLLWPMRRESVKRQKDVIFQQGDNLSGLFQKGERNKDKDHRRCGCRSRSGIWWMRICSQSEENKEDQWVLAVVYVKLGGRRLNATWRRRRTRGGLGFKAKFYTLPDRVAIHKRGGRSQSAKSDDLNSPFKAWYFFQMTVPYIAVPPSHPDQPQKCKRIRTPVCPLLAGDQQTSCLYLWKRRASLFRLG